MNMTDQARELDSRSCSGERPAGRAAVGSGSDVQLTSLDHHAVAAGELWALAIHTHVVSTSSPRAISDLASVSAADGVSCHAYAGVCHSRSGLWLSVWQPVAVEPQGVN